MAYFIGTYFTAQGLVDYEIYVVKTSKTNKIEII